MEGVAWGRWGEEREGSEGAVGMWSGFCEFFEEDAGRAGDYFWAAGGGADADKPDFEDCEGRASGS